MNRPTGLPARYYTEPEIFDQELDRIFGHSWVLVGHRSQVAVPGRLITARIGRESIIVANDRATIRAFYNVCPHRGHELVLDDEQQTDSITCPYHAWTYDLGGRLLHARGEEVGELCAPAVRLDELAGFLFVNPDPAAPTLAETVPGVEDELLGLAPDAPSRVLAARRTHEIEANWKIAIENYNECYHCPNVHKTFSARVVSASTYRIRPEGFTIRHTAEGPSAAGAARHTSEAPSTYGSFYTWPVSSIQCYPGQVLNTFRWVPLAVDRTLLVREWWLPRTEPTADQQALIELDWTTTVAEDVDLMDSVQRGVRSRGYRPGPLITRPSGVATIHSEDTVPHLHSLVRAALGE